MMTNFKINNILLSERIEKNTMTADPNDCSLRKTSQFPTEMFKESKPTSLMKMLHETFTQLSNAVETHPFLEGYFRSRFQKSTFTSAISLGRTNKRKCGNRTVVLVKHLQAVLKENYHSKTPLYP